MMPNLMPCPMPTCGAPIDTVHLVPHGMGAFIYVIRCDCGLSFDTGAQSEAAAADRWNERPAPGEQYTYASKQETNCAGCGVRKHTPLRVDDMGGYVCLTCIDKQLDEFFAKPSPAEVAELDDLAALVRKLVQAIEKICPGNYLGHKALDYLKRKGLQGSPLRSEEQS